MSEEAVKILEGVISSLKDIKEQLIKVSRMLRGIPPSIELLDIAYRLDDFISEISAFKTDLEFLYETE
ncbi:MAG: hypothetical protein DRP11_01960 [Candidatus Aenigmatarchaeota archaeon]|nr:MAG: hypothetical protein DRP11_01960 [Candidatus Aenigmarchaeota archaeon]